MAFAVWALPSGAAWQCLDGHACPPGCTMQRVGSGSASRAPGSLPACCGSHAGAPGGHCPLCSGARPQHARMSGQCTSPVCVLRVQAKPDVTTGSHFHPAVVFALVAALPPPVAPIPAPESPSPATFSSPRAPPERPAAPPRSPRAPPSLL
ncbi:MAG TPA: hypothetical protein VKT77_19200 [Chthonomonadaceae bacterium]|nr:hypothetical protein [Chthonomonadaceae bacterium]